MKKVLEVYSSNRLEILYQQLKNTLFQPHFPPLLRRLVVVYGQAMKEWLILRMAEDPDLNISMGVEFLYYAQAFGSLRQLTGGKAFSCFPSQLELSLAIEVELFNLFAQFPSLDSEEQRDWLPILHYLGFKKFNDDAVQKISRKNRRRLIALSDQLAHLFLDYGRYAISMTEKWEHSEVTGWQARLWRRIFSNETGWEHLGRSLQCNIKPDQFSLHFFSISFMPDAEFLFINRLAEKIPVHFYLLSPCAVFWSDIRSDRECQRLEKNWTKKLGQDSPQLLQLEEILRDRNPLLANFGRIGREMSQRIEESEATVHSLYTFPDHVKELHEDVSSTPDVILEKSQTPLTLLHALQADLLLMRNPEKDHQVIIDHDDISLQLHAAPCKRREVEILYHTLLSIIHRDSSIVPRDIIVMSPEIKEYVPYIESVFGQKDSLLDFQIGDRSVTENQVLIQGFIELLELSAGRWDAEALLRFFSNPSFQRRYQLSPNDLTELRRWVEKTGIRWGHDSIHRNKILQGRHCRRGMVDETAVGTWDYGVSRLVLGLVVPDDGHMLDFSDGDLLGRWIQIIQSLFDDLSPLSDGTFMTVPNWASYLKCLLESYLSHDENDIDSVKEADELISVLNHLAEICISNPEHQFPFDSIKSRLDVLLDNIRLEKREQKIQAVRFYSLIPLRSIPTKVIAVMGMQDEAFPRSSRRSSLNMMHNDPAFYYPEAFEFDRYLFLEVIHSAQEYLLFSYCCFHEKDHKEQKPSLLIEELFSYLDKGYSIKGKSISEKSSFIHPFDTFNPLYFSEESGYYNYSAQDYRAALASLGSAPQDPYQFIANWICNDTSLEYVPLKDFLPLNDLVSLMKDPIRFHFNKSLSVYLKNPEDRVVKTEEELVISNLERSIFRQKGVKESIDDLLGKAERESKLPFGVFREVAENQVISESNKIEEALKKWSLTSFDLFEIELSSHCIKATQLDERTWIHPPLEINLENGTEVSIIGKIPYATKKGLVFLDKASFSSVWKSWPLFLVFCSILPTLPKPCAPAMIPLFSKKPLEAFFKEPQYHLEQIVNYYAFSLAHFSPLMPELIPEFLEGNEQVLRKSIEKLLTGAFKSYQSPYLPRVFSPGSIPDLTFWKGKAECLAGELIQSWFPSKSASLEETT